MTVIKEETQQQQKSRALLPPEDPPAAQNQNHNQQPKPANNNINLDDEDEGYISQPPSNNNNNTAAASSAPPINLDDEDEGYINPNKPANNNNTTNNNYQQPQQPQPTAPAASSSPATQTQPQPQNQQQQQQQNPVKTKIPKTEQWQTKILYDEGISTKECLFGFCCVPCAQASAKSDLDGSHVLYNCLCWHHGMTYSWLRSVYNIKSNCGSDMMAAIFCSCCAGRRILSEVRVRKENGQEIENLEKEKPEWIESLFGCSGCGIAQAMFCSCCQAHEARMFLQNTEELDCCFDCCCFNPCAMYGQVRHQYKIASTIGHPLFEDICVPFFCMPCALNRAVREARAYKNS